MPWPEKRPDSPRGIAAGRLDLYNISPHVGHQLAAINAHGAGQVEDPKAGQRLLFLFRQFFGQAQDLEGVSNVARCWHISRLILNTVIKGHQSRLRATNPALGELVEPSFRREVLRQAQDERIKLEVTDELKR